MITNLTSDQLAYLDAQMNKVSRSFALVAPAVEAPLNNYLPQLTPFAGMTLLKKAADCAA